MYSATGTGLFALLMACMCVAFLLVCLRAYAASKLEGRWRLDFIWITVALVFDIASGAAMIVAIGNGLGSHVEHLTHSQIFAALYWIWVSIYIALAAGVFAKFSIIALLLRTQGDFSRKRNAILYSIGALVAIPAIIQFFLSYFQCEPVEKLWLPYLDGSCPRLRLAGQWSYFHGVIMVLTDISLALWPLVIVWNLQVSWQLKLGVCSLTSVGMIATACAILRMKALPYIAKSEDLTYDFSHFLIWGTLELWLVTILSCVPPLRPLFMRVCSHLHSASRTLTRAATSTTDTSREQIARAGIEAGIKAGTEMQTLPESTVIRQTKTVGIQRSNAEEASDEESLYRNSEWV